MRYVGTLGGVTQSSLRPGQGLLRVLVLSRSDWDNCSSIYKPGGIQTLLLMCPGQNLAHKGQSFQALVLFRTHQLKLSLELHLPLKLFVLDSQNWELGLGGF